MSYDKITVVINTFKSEDQIHQCLKSIASEVNILIVENSKNILFKNELEKKYSNVKCILAGQNLGYAKGNNLGLSKVKTKYALVLNPDAVLEHDTLNRLLLTAKKFPDFSIIGPAKQDEYSKDDLKPEQQEVFQAKSLKGFAMFLNIDQFSEIGFFDDNFFIYLEEIDLCKRLINKNKKIFLDKKVIIHHKGGSSHNKEINFEMELSRNSTGCGQLFLLIKNTMVICLLCCQYLKIFSSIFKIIYIRCYAKKKKNLHATFFRNI